MFFYNSFLALRDIVIVILIEFRFCSIGNAAVLLFFVFSGPLIGIGG
jgi:hypothetical protein